MGAFPTPQAAPDGREARRVSPALRKALAAVQKIEADLADFDGDRRGHFAALSDAKRAVFRILAEDEEDDDYATAELMFAALRTPAPAGPSGVDREAVTDEMVAAAESAIEVVRDAVLEEGPQRGIGRRLACAALEAALAVAPQGSGGGFDPTLHNAGQINADAKAPAQPGHDAGRRAGLPSEDALREAIIASRQWHGSYQLDIDATRAARAVLTLIDPPATDAGAPASPDDAATLRKEVARLTRELQGAGEIVDSYHAAMTMYRKRAEAAEAKLAEAERRNTDLENGLRPFADQCSALQASPYAPDERTVVAGHSLDIRVGDLRRARALLARSDDQTAGRGAA